MADFPLYVIILTLIKNISSLLDGGNLDLVDADFFVGSRSWSCIRNLVGIFSVNRVLSQTQLVAGGSAVELFGSLHFFLILARHSIFIKLGM